MSEAIKQVTELFKILLMAPDERFWGIVGLAVLALLVYAYTKEKRE